MTNRNFIKNLVFALTALGGCAGMSCDAPVSAMENNPTGEIQKARLENQESINEVLQKLKNNEIMTASEVDSYCTFIRRNFCIIGMKKTQAEKTYEQELALRFTKWALQQIQLGKELTYKVIFQIKCLTGASGMRDIYGYEEKDSNKIRRNKKIKEIQDRLGKYKPEDIKDDLNTIEELITNFEAEQAELLEKKTIQDIKVQEEILKLKKQKENECVII